MEASRPTAMARSLMAAAIGSCALSRVGCRQSPSSGPSPCTACRERLLVDNPLDRYSIGSRTEGLAQGADGSAEIYMQADNPGPQKQSNWLPAPKGPFFFVGRFYGPKQEALDGRLFASAGRGRGQYAKLRASTRPAADPNVGAEPGTHHPRTGALALQPIM